MPRRSRPPQLHLTGDWSEFLHLLQKHRVRFLVVGAHALAAHGRPRFTGDFDVFVDATPANARRVCAALREFGVGGAARRERRRDPAAAPTAASEKLGRTQRLVEQRTEVVERKLEPEPPTARQRRAPIRHGGRLRRRSPRVEERSLQANSTIAERSRPMGKPPVPTHLRSEIEKHPDRRLLRAGPRRRYKPLRVHPVAPPIERDRERTRQRRVLVRQGHCLDKRLFDVAALLRRTSRR